MRYGEPSDYPQRVADGETVTGLLIDIDGVIYEGERPVPGAADVLAWLTEAGVPHLFVTNTTSRPLAAVVAKLAGFGIQVQPESVLTPAIAARRWLATHAPGPVALFVPPATTEDFGDLATLAEEAESGAAAVVIGDLGEAWNFQRLNRAFRLLMSQPAPALVALGMTRYWRADDGLRLDVAPFVKALEHATGLEATVLGKPAQAFFSMALDILGTAPAESCMLGDDIAADVGGAQRAGLRGLLVRTGKFRGADLEGDIRPHAVLGSLADLPGWWRSSGST